MHKQSAPPDFLSPGFVIHLTKPCAVPNDRESDKDNKHSQGALPKHGPTILLDLLGFAKAFASQQKLHPAGGAVVSLLVGWLGDRFGLRAGMTVLYLTLGYIMAIGIWAKPLVDNATVSLKELISLLRRRPTAAR